MKIGDYIYDEYYGWGVCEYIEDLYMRGRFQTEELNLRNEKYMGHRRCHFDIIDYYHDRKDYLNYYKYKIRNKLWDYTMDLTDAEIIVIIVLAIGILSIIILGLVVYAN